MSNFIGLVYRIDDLVDGKFYIGKCENLESWKNGYTGSGRKWKNHLKAHPDHKIKRTILKDNFSSKQELFEYELQEIKKVFKDKNCCNLKDTIQGEYVAPQPCEECGSKSSTHKKGCSKAKVCSECGGLNGIHKKGCSKFKAIICPECGGKSGLHFDFCSKSKGKCEYCGYSLQSHIHSKKCPLYKEFKERTPCPECGSKSSHKSWCSRSNTTMQPCVECGGLRGNHKKDCIYYKTPEICSECGGRRGKHKKHCSKYKVIPPCPECGGRHNTHKKGCSKYKSPKPCSECGSKGKTHKKTCSHYKKPKESEPCVECGGLRGRHKKSCSLHKKNL